MARVPLQSQEEVDAVLREGEKRARYGQTNTRNNQSPFKNPPSLRARHKLTRLVLEFLTEVEVLKFHAMSDIAEWRRLEEIRKIAVSQIKEDTGAWIHIQFKIGQQNIQVIEIWDEETPDNTPRPKTRIERAIEMAMDMLVVQLPEAQQQTIKLRFYENLSIKDSARARQVSQETIRYLEKKAKRNLISYFQEEGWITEKEVEDLGIRREI